MEAAVDRWRVPGRRGADARSASAGAVAGGRARAALLEDLRGRGVLSEDEFERLRARRGD